MRIRAGGSTAWAHLAVLWALAFAQPLFDVLADSPEFFVARGNTRADILIFASVLVLVPPTILVGIERVLPAGLDPKVGPCRLRRASCGGDLLQFLDGTGGTGAVLIPAAGAARRRFWPTSTRGWRRCAGRSPS